jgi:hypothetical protein
MKKVIFSLVTALILSTALNAQESKKQSEPQSLKLQVNSDALNILFESLHAQPYGAVAPLLTSLYQQCNKQSTDTAGNRKPVPSSFKVEVSLVEFRAIIESLYAQPYAKVALLIDNLTAQARKQFPETKAKK